MPNNTPSFFIIGAMKCATTTLHEQLSAQPGVFMSDLKEPNFFSDDENYERGIDDYLTHFEAAAPGDICGESSTHYSKLPTHPHTVQRLKQYSPNAKLVYVMRHPTDRLVSQYVHEWTQRVISASLSEAIDYHPELYQYSLYSMQLRPYLETFGPENVLPVFFERLKDFPDAELARIGRFIGCDRPTAWQSDTAHRHPSKERMRPSPWRDALVNAPILRSIRKKLVPQEVRDRIKGMWQMQNRPQLSADAKASVEARFDQDLAVLGQWLGMTLSCQNFTEVAAAAQPEWVRSALPSTLPSQPLDLPVNLEKTGTF